MAGSSLLTLIDDIATLLDDIAVLTKVAAKKTGGVLGDDLALNAQQVTGFPAERELPVVFAVAKGSVINKLILVPSALLVSEFAPFVIVPLLICGGLYLCYEGSEKIFEKFFHPHEEKKAARSEPGHGVPPEEVKNHEHQRIRGAVRTDFILSAEIVVITLGTVATESFMKRSSVLAFVSIIMTVGVYGLVALIVKLDDIGLHLMKDGSHPRRVRLGAFLLGFAPKLMRFLGVAGTFAMFMVGGGIISHNVHVLHHMFESIPGWISWIAEALLGLIAGGLCVAGSLAFERIKLKRSKS